VDWAQTKRDGTILKKARARYPMQAPPPGLPCDPAPAPHLVAGWHAPLWSPTLGYHLDTQPSARPVARSGSLERTLRHEPFHLAQPEGTAMAWWGISQRRNPSWGSARPGWMSCWRAHWTHEL